MAQLEEKAAGFGDKSTPIGFRSISNTAAVDSESSEDKAESDLDGEPNDEESSEKSSE